MLKYIVLLMSILITSCATQHIPMPAPIPSCDMKVNGECREQSASEKGGAVVRGHGETKDVTP